MDTFLSSRRGRLGAGLIIFFAILAVYLNSFQGPFVFDDVTGIAENPTLRHLSSALFPPPGALTVSGRPVLSLSLALNYAVSGTDVGSYHAVNLLIHLLATLTLFGLVRRTLARMATGGRSAGPWGSTLSALAVALLWGLHPLQTESVTYIVQRAESLMGLLYLLTLYGFVRYAETGRKAWAWVSVLGCLLGMGTKEVMVSAPVIVLLYDRAFISGSFQEAWGRRKNLYACLAGTWILLAFLVILNGDHAGTAGFSAGQGCLAYWLTQFPAIVRYLGLSICPYPLVFDYGMQSVPGLPVVAPAGAMVGLLVAGTAVALWRNSALGFLGAWFFAILAPTSLVPGTQQTMAEHRMYLPLAAVLALGTMGLAAVARRAPAWRNPGLAVLAVFGLVLGIGTVSRNDVYRSDLAVWMDTVAKRPALAIAHHNLGRAYAERGRLGEAIAQDQEALRLNHDSVFSRLDLAGALEQAGRLPEALVQYQEAVALQPGWAGTHCGLAGGLSRAGRQPEAMAEYRRALLIKPDYAQAEDGLGMALFRSGDIDGAIGHFQSALRMDPEYALADNNLGTALARANRLPEAVACFQRALQLKPDDAEAHLNLGNAFYQADRLSDAIHEYAAALRERPGTAEEHDHFGILLAQAGRPADAEAQFRDALRLKPDDAEVQGNLRRLLVLEAAVPRR
jgi:tetratricopeptide (TPR) repeat protein